MSTRVITFPRRVRRLRAGIRPHIIRRGTPTAGSVLAYIERMQQYAHRQHRSEFERHYAELWRFVFEVTHGLLPSSPAAPVCPAPVSSAPGQAPAPPWKRQILARPMRKVVDVSWDYRRGPTKNSAYTIAVLHLSCGHKVDDIILTPFHPAPQRRRCKECAKL